MKLFKRSVIVYQYMCFLVLSYLYYYILVSFDSGESSFDLSQMMRFMAGNKFLLLLLIFSIVSVYLVKKWSKYFVLIFMIVILYSEFYVFFSKLDKIILVLVFFHVLTFFNYYLLWNIELEDVIYQPGFSKHDCWKKYFYDFVSEIELKNGIILPVKLTNWDRRGVFCMVDESDQKMDTLSMKSPVILRLKFEHEIFEEMAEVVSSYDKGYGFKFIKSKVEKTGWGWRDFYTIIRDRGYTPFFART